MKLRTVFSAGRTLRRLRSADKQLREAAVDAAADALHGSLTRAGESAVTVRATDIRLAIGSQDPADAVREFGTLNQSPSPWLAPALPLALEPMRAAALVRVREVFAAHTGNENAAARAASETANRKK